MAFEESFVDPAQFADEVGRWLGPQGDGGVAESVTLLVYGTVTRRGTKKPQLNSQLWYGTFTWKPSPEKGKHSMHVGQFLADEAARDDNRLEEGKVYAVMARDPFEMTTIAQTFVLVGDPVAEEEEGEAAPGSPLDDMVVRMQNMAIQSVENSIGRVMNMMGGSGEGSTVGGPGGGLVPLSDGSYAPQQWMLMQSQHHAQERARMESELREQRELIRDMQAGRGSDNFMDTIGKVLAAVASQKSGENPVAALMGAFAGNSGVVQMPNGRAATVAGSGFNPDDPYSSFLVDQCADPPVNTRRAVVAPPGFGPRTQVVDDEYDGEDFEDGDEYEDEEEEVVEVKGMSGVTELRPLARELFGVVYGGFQEHGEAGAKQAGQEEFAEMALRHGATPMEVKCLGPIAEDYAEMLLQALPVTSQLLVKVAGRAYVKRIMVDIIVAVAASM